MVRRSAPIRSKPEAGIADLLRPGEETRRLAGMGPRRRHGAGPTEAGIIGSQSDPSWRDQNVALGATA